MNLNEKTKFAFTHEDSLIKELNFNPYYQEISSGAELYMQIGDRKYLNLAANNYLALSHHPKVIAAMKKALDSYGASMCGTPIACGNVDIYQLAVRKIAAFVGLTNAILYPSCYQANIAVINALIKPTDIAFVDRFAHSSLIEGIKSTGCKIKPFKHNDMNHLEKLINHSESYSSRFVITESVFSTEGSIAPFNAINALAKKYGLIPIIDDSHGIGVIGRTGRGILEEKQITEFSGIYTASIGKALGIAGGVVAGNQQLIEFLKYSSPGLIYSTSIPPVLIAGIITALDVVTEMGDNYVKKLAKAKKYIYDNLQKLGLKLSVGEAFICSVICGSNLATFQLCKALYEKQIITTPFIYPSVSKNKGIVRMILRIDLEQQQLDEIIEAFAEVARDYPEYCS